MIKFSKAVMALQAVLPTAYCAGSLTTGELTHTFITEGLAAGDILEIGTLEAGLALKSVEIIADNLGAGQTVDLVTLTGEPGDDEDASRAEDTTITAGIAAHNSAEKAATRDLLAFKTGKKHVGLGVKFNQIVAPAADAKITLVMQYTV